LVQGTGAALGVKLLSAGVLYGTQILLARWLGVVEYGVYDFAIATAFSMALWNIWLHAIVVKRLDVHPSILATFR
jgi:O-antigen/teichoic acid export membrane protein